MMINKMNDLDAELGMEDEAANWRMAEEHNNIGTFYFQAGNLEKAIAHYRRCIELHDAPENNPDHHEPLVLDHLAGLACYNLGLVYMQKTDYKQAIEQFTKAISFGEPRKDILLPFIEDANKYLEMTKVRLDNSINTKMP